MTTRTELLEIVANGENSGVEFKRDDLRNHDLAKELVALLNLDGGIVLLGVADNGAFPGLARNDLEEWVMSVCRDKIRPAIVPFFELVREVDGSNDVAVVRVPRGQDVHTLWHNNANRYLMRVGSQSREASQEELARLFRQRGSVPAELSCVSGAKFEDFDHRRLTNYFSQIREQAVPNDDDQDAWISLLNNTEFMSNGDLSVLGLLLFGKTPNRFLPYAGIDAVAYSGNEQDYDTLERSTLRGPMTPLLNKDGEIVENGLVEQALDFVQRNTRRSVAEDGGRRIEKLAYPTDALREGIVNALIHRDYLLTNTDIQLAVYRDRLEIVSPGRLPNGVTPDGMRLGTRASRNQLLKEVMRDYRYVEHMGMGIRLKIIKGMKAHNGTEPDLIELHERFLVRLHAGDPK